ncbi:preprotein translocase subunit SecY [Candidatus Babeliales bacterium]|nr:preprotein translocase subunit SecY [Candidatus Babeliales bacterium]
MVVLIRNFKNIFLVTELRNKLLFTLGVFAVYRLGTHIPIPGINTHVFSKMISSGGVVGGLISYLNLFSGGALKRFAIFALGMGPYINASIMIQLLTVMIPSLEQLSKEGEQGRRVINQYTRYLTLGLSVMYGLSTAMFVERMEGLAIAPGWGFRLTTTIILTVGAMFVMWLGEQINSHGIGNGSSMIIFAGILANFPGAMMKVFEKIRLGGAEDIFWAGLLAVFTIAVISCIVFLERGERRIPVQYAKRVVGQKVYGGQSSYIPLKLNSAGVIPVIFASALISMPIAIISLLSTKLPFLKVIAEEWLRYGGLLYSILTAGMIMFFSFFYTAIIFNPVELADNIRKSGGFIPGIRPGRRTADFFDYILTRVGFPGAVYLAVLAILPGIIQNMFPHFPTMFDGISLLIVVGVALDTSSQLESQLIERRYEGFLSTGRLKGRRG